MAENSSSGGKEDSQTVLDFSNKGVSKMGKLPKRPNASKLVLNHNNITKIENLDAFPKLLSLSVANNHLLRMNGINFAKNLTSLDLSNNGIVVMEGLCWLVHLEHLDLSKNNIKKIQNVSYCTKLQYMDLSENSIEDISDLSSLVQLKTLLLHGNTISTLQKVGTNLPVQLETFSLAGNHVSDLNEVHHLSNLKKIKHFSLLNNPCVISTPSLPGIDYRPFVIYCCPTLTSLDGFGVQDLERNHGEKLESDENLRKFSTGDHVPLVLYLSKVAPVSSGQQLQDDQETFLRNFLEAKNSEKILQKGNTNSKDSSARYDNFSNDNLDEGEDVADDLLRSESSFLPVYSPLKKSLDINDRGGYLPSSIDHVPTWDHDSMGSTTQQSNDEFPIMTEEEASKLIHLAATILQTHIRGFLIRRKFDFKHFKRTYNAASKIQALWRGYYYRNLSEEGKNFRQELRIYRLQKYLSIVCFMMQKSEEEHEIEKKQLLEAVHILYEKVDQLSTKVEEQNTRNVNEQCEMEEYAARVLQKHWRGYSIRKKLNKRTRRHNILDTLLISHNELIKKVMYLESLVSKKKTNDPESETHEVVQDPLQSTPNNETKSQLLFGDNNVDQQDKDHHTPKQPLPDGDTGIDHDDQPVIEENKEQSLIATTSLDLEGKTKENSIADGHDHGESPAGEKDIVNNEEDVDTDVDNTAPSEDSSGNAALEIYEDIENKDVSQVGTKGIPIDNNGGQLGTCSVYEQHHITLETETKGDLERTGNRTTSGPKDGNGDYLDHSYTVVDMGPCYGGTKIEGGTSKEDSELSGVVGVSEEIDGYQAADEEGEDTADVVVDLSSGGDELLGIERDSLGDVPASDPARSTSCETEGSSNQEGKETAMDEHGSVTESSEGIVEVSPRLGQRASSLLSALKTELTTDNSTTTSNETTSELTSFGTSDQDESSSLDTSHDNDAPPKITITHAPDNDTDIDDDIPPQATDNVPKEEQATTSNTSSAEQINQVASSSDQSCFESHQTSSQTLSHDSDNCSPQTTPSASVGDQQASSDQTSVHTSNDAAGSDPGQCSSS